MKFITEGFDLSLSSNKFINGHFQNVLLQKAHLLVLRFLQLPGLLEFSFFFAYAGGKHVTLTRCKIEVRHRSVGVLVLEINEVQDQLGI